MCFDGDAPAPGSGIDGCGSAYLRSVRGYKPVDMSNPHLAALYGGKQPSQYYTQQITQQTPSPYVFNEPVKPMQQQQVQQSLPTGGTVLAMIGVVGLLALILFA